jgi:hypothetical protein
MVPKSAPPRLVLPHRQLPQLIVQVALPTTNGYRRWMKRPKRERRRAYQRDTEDLFTVRDAHCVPNMPQRAAWPAPALA